MKIIKDFFFSFFISYEFVVFLIFLFMFKFFPNIFSSYLEQLSFNGDFIKWVVFIPCGTFIYVLKNYRDLLSPNHDNWKCLNNYPDYYLLKNRYWVTMIYLFISILLGIFYWVKAEYLESDMFLILLCSILISIISFITFHNAVISLSRILDTIEKNTP